jgi:hypothetical protein
LQCSISTISTPVQAPVCGHTLSCRNTSPYVSIPCLLFWTALHISFSVLQYTSDLTVVPCCMNSIISTPFSSKKRVAIRFLADLVCLMHVYEFTALADLWFYKWNPDFITLLVQWNREIHHNFCGTTLESQSWSHWLHFVCTHLHRTLEKICGKLLLSQIVWWTWTRSTLLHWLQMATTLLFIVNTVCVPIFDHSTPMSYSSLTPYILAVNHAHDEFLQHYKFLVKKGGGDNSTNFVAVRILGNQLCDGLQGNESYEATWHARALPCSYISYLQYNTIIDFVS